MDIFTVPSPDDPGMGYAYLVMTLVFIAASYSVYRFKKANRKKEKQAENLPVYDMYETKEEHDSKTDAKGDRSE
ncbi:hypothetical protein [Alkalicoccus luteus]|uniref:Uncharacterized protein n=1 Tax=Alkalicoccus luteus TaxID=1237094 RepID=A0A969PNH7_9BACI|nr:hypothetical protein [Alkalicoccus luteus]NJP36645.1 hypothetical protein [Alkalicoccus luteus]